MKVKKQFLIAMSICIILSILYVVLYSAQGNTTAYLTKININKHETIDLYNREHKDTKKFDDYPANEDIFLDTQIDKYVYSFVLSPNSKIFRKNFIYNIYPDFYNLHEDIEYAYMNTHGDKYGNLVSIQKIAEDSIGPVAIMRSMNDEVLSWLLISFVIVVFVCVVMPICVSKTQDYINKIYVNKNICNQYTKIQAFTPPPPVYPYLFILYVILLSLFLVVQYGMVSLDGDNWLMSSVYDSFYMPYDTTIGWQRGRHFADLFMSLSMRPFGEMLVALGVSPIRAFNIFASFFTLVFYGMFFIGSSVFIWLCNGKQQFKTIFILVSLVFLLIINGRFDYVTTGAYIGSAGIALLVFLPILYFFMYKKVFLLSSNIYLQSGLLFFLVYMASFQTEPSTLPIFGLTLLLSFYMYWRRDNFGISCFTYYHMGLFLILVPTAFVLTMISGRGQTQVGVMEKTTLFGNMMHVFKEINAFSIFVVSVGLLYFIYLVVYCIKHAKITEILYLKIAALFVGLLGVVGFACIKVPGVWFEVMLIALVLILTLLEIANGDNIVKAWCSNFLLVGFVFCAILQNVNIFERNFIKYYNLNTQDTLISLFQHAETNNLKEIVLTPQDVETMLLSFQRLSDDERAWPNRDISAWMQRYYVRTYIPIRVSNEK
ncbi:hypothetical protein [Helicobacter bilis]|uniref:hypothetical protein n=1 Tax=Helicobacter bilis TaxID=37372 RepID=UPI0010FDFE67|nr:hypothetical protein [Helicobacter bilis]MDY4399482.1 hypothetical protein [Helicobacter bilis]TLE10230.1 hypothetical protein LS78_000630 [Helicobacter bilis]